MDGSMVGKDRDDDSGRYSQTYPPEDFLDAIEAASGAAGTREIAEAVGCSVDTAIRRLNELEAGGRVSRREVGNAFLWRLAGGGDS